MPRPKVYIHRHGPRYNLYLNEANLAELASFSEIVSDGEQVEALPPDEMTARLRGCDAILSFSGGWTDNITAEVLRNAGTLRAICIGHWGGQLAEAAATAGIPCVEGSNGNTVAVAEWTVTAALMSVRQLHVFDRRLKEGSAWGEPRRSVGLFRGSVVGLVGLGRIGRYAAQLFRSLGADVLAYDTGYSAEQAKQLGICLTSLDEVLRAADVVSLHLPVTNGTRNLLKAHEFSLLRDGCVFINSARAELYDEPALIRELQTGRFSAVLDVFNTEPLPLDHPLRTLQNVVLTPHIAGDNLAMCRRCGREAIQTLRDFFAGNGLVDRRLAFP